MSFSLSSLLNPSPDAEAAPPPTRRDSLPPIHYVQSPEQHFAASPQSAHPPRDHLAHPPTTEQDAVQALAALSGSNAPPPFQSQWYGQNAPRPAYDGRTNSYEQRPGSSGYQEPVQLPRPSSSGRHPISPTLDQYHVASRSPEQRRPSMISPTQAGFTLPPIQAFTPSQPGHSPPQLNAYEPPSQIRPPTAEGSHATANSEAKSSTQQGQHASHANSHNDHAKDSSSQTHLHSHQPTTAAMADDSSSPSAPIKQEMVVTPRASSPIEPRRENDQTPAAESQSLKAIASLKNEHGLRTQSPLRESSVPVPSTETAAPEASIPKKRPAPSKTKKGTATAKKAPPAKKRKFETTKPFALKPGSSVSTPAGSSPAPSTRSQTDDVDDEPYEEDEDMQDDEDGDADGDVYCICRKPDTGTFMIGCDGTCDDWFHGKCVGIEERDKNLIDKYVCPQCTKGGAGKTTWKRFCRRSGCRQPARVGKIKGGKDGSKYCSEECGVLFFREMVSRTRGREDTSKHRNSRRKGSTISSDRPGIDYDLGARGGTLAAGELKSLVNSSTTADDFKKLGEGVLSPPATPDSKASKESEFIASESQALQHIHRRKEESRRKHQLLKDRMKFVTMVKQAASRAATEKELKPKDYCGYDSRLEWADELFDKWRHTHAGKQAFELDTLATEREGEEMPIEEEAEFEFEVCDRKKCARHLEWNKLAVDDVRFEMSDNGDRMRALEKEEKDLRERAALRAKAGSLNGEGRVEVHGLGISLEQEQPQQQREQEMVVDTVETIPKSEGELPTPAAAA